MKQLDAATKSSHPNLSRFGYKVTSERDRKYNCAAWAADDNTQWWEPFQEHGVFWPPEVPMEDSLDNYIQAFETIGYAKCEGATFQFHLEKIAIYKDDFGSFMHAARQLADGSWTSKLGSLEDIQHETLAALEDKNYGHVGLIMARRCSFLGSLLRIFFKIKHLVCPS